MTRTEDAAVLARSPTYESLLAPDELARRARFQFPRHRHEYLVTRALVRVVLGGYAGVSPESLVFRPGTWGKPELTFPPDAHGLSFNLSNTDGMVVCLVARRREVGVDVERTDRRGELLDVAERFFAPDEARALRALPAPRRLERFFVYWTLKESYIKARGMGLAIPLGDFAFDVTEPSRPAIAFAGTLVDDPRSWRFGTTTLAPAFRVSHALRVGEGEEPTVRVLDTVP